MSQFLTPRVFSARRLKSLPERFSTPGAVLPPRTIAVASIVPLVPQCSCCNAGGNRWCGSDEDGRFWRAPGRSGYGNARASDPGMPRREIRATGGLVFHVCNRAIRNGTLFSEPGDYLAFLSVLVEAAVIVPMRLLAFSLMKTHWHLVLWPREDGHLTRYVYWVTMTHARRWHIAHGTLGRGAVYQGRFRAIPVETSIGLVTVCSYVERNAHDAGYVTRAEDWRWSSAAERPPDMQPDLHEWPVPRPTNWLEILNEPQRSDAVARLRECISRNVPFGSDEWRDEIVTRLHWRTGLRPGGRPRGNLSGSDFNRRVETSPGETAR